MRDKLAGILLNYNSGLQADRIADYLIRNNVSVFPCKIGEDVWLIPRYNGKAMGFIQADKIQMIGITSRGIHIRARSHHPRNKTYILGKTAFLSKEDAEEALQKEVLYLSSVQGR